ncbi:MAG TPA: copper chaperone PCu(A)C [Allosphingosinicella sp.]|jgi:copper(I)-binding protein
MRIILGTALLLALSGCEARPTEPQVTVEQAWVQLPVLAGRPGAAYFTLVATNQPTKLVSVTSPRIERIELHESVMAGGAMRMGPLRDPGFGDGGRLEFAPGGKHAMLFGIDPALKAGDRIPLTFTFEPAPPVTTQAEVRAFGAAGRDGH